VLFPPCFPHNLNLLFPLHCPQTVTTTTTTSTTTTTTTIEFQQGILTAYRINCGASFSFVDSRNKQWAADTFVSGGQSYSNPDVVVRGANGPDQLLYTVLQTSPSFFPTMSYNLPVSVPGLYLLRLRFAEVCPCATGAGERSFSVFVQGQQILTNLDLVARAGYAQAYFFEVEVEIGSTFPRLALTFGRNIGNPAIAGIELLLLSAFDPNYKPPTTPEPSTTSTAIEVDTEEPAGVIVDIQRYTLYRINAASADSTTVTSQGKTEVWGPDVDYVVDLDVSQTRTACLKDFVATLGRKEIFCRERRMPFNAGDLVYRLPVPTAPLEYTVRLFFAESNWPFRNPGARVMDVSLQGRVVLHSFDVATTAGFLTGHIEEHSVLVAAGETELEIRLSPLKGTPIINGIEVLANDLPADVVASFPFVDVQTFSTIVYTTSSASTSPTTAATTTTTATPTASSSAPTTATATTTSTTTRVSSAIEVTGTAVPAGSYVLYRINAGYDEDVVDSQGKAWTRDMLFIGGEVARRLDRAVIGRDALDIPIFNTQRAFLQTQTQPLYTVRLPSRGTYHVRLHFNEMAWAARLPGRRVFSVDMAGQRVLSELDVATVAGGRFTPITFEATLQAAGPETLFIRFVGQVGNAIVSGIEVYAAALPRSVVDSFAFAEAPPLDGPFLSTMVSSSTTSTEPPTTTTAAAATVDGSNLPADAVLQSGLPPTLNNVFVLHRLNAGLSASLLDSFGKTWSADSFFTGGKAYANCIVNIDNVPQVDQLIYCQERNQPLNLPDLVYVLPVPVAGQRYFIRMHFAEVFGEVVESGFRVFDVLINGETRLSDVDVLDMVGFGRAMAVTLPVDLAAGANPMIVLTFRRIRGNPKINGIEVYAQTLPESARARAVFETGAGVSVSTSMTTVGSGGQATTTAQPETVPPSSVVEDDALYRINVGSAEYGTDSSGRVWLPDTNFNGGVTRSACYKEISGAGELGFVYCTERRMPQGSGFDALEYLMPVPSVGEYEVELLFAESYWNTRFPGQRVFDILVQGVALRPAFDIVAAGGYLQATSVTLPVVVVEGLSFISVSLRGVVSQPKLSGLVLRPKALAPTSSKVASTTATQVSTTTAAGGSSSSGAATTTVKARTTFEPPATSVGSVEPGVDTFGNTGSASIRINCGGAGHASALTGAVWASDATFASGGLPLQVGGSVNILGTSEDVVAGSQRRGASFALEVPLPAPGVYIVELYFAELAPTAQAGQNVFTVTVAGNSFLKDYDVAATAPGVYRTTVRSVVVFLSGSTLRVALAASKGEAMLNALAIYSA
jgi:hypothetical protein